VFYANITRMEIFMLSFPCNGPPILCLDPTPLLSFPPALCLMPRAGPIPCVGCPSRQPDASCLCRALTLAQPHRSPARRSDVRRRAALGGFATLALLRGGCRARLAPPARSAGSATRPHMCLAHFATARHPRCGHPQGPCTSHGSLLSRYRALLTKPAMPTMAIALHGEQ